MKVEVGKHYVTQGNALVEIVYKLNGKYVAAPDPYR